LYKKNLEISKKYIELDKEFYYDAFINDGTPYRVNVLREELVKYANICYLKNLTKDELLVYICQNKQCCFNRLHKKYKTYEILILYLKYRIEDKNTKTYNYKILDNINLLLFRLKHDENAKWDIIMHNPTIIRYLILLIGLHNIDKKLIIECAKKCYIGFITLKKYYHELITDDIITSILKIDGTVLQIVPYNLIRKKHCNIAVKQNGIALFYVPDKYHTENLQNNALKYNVNCFKYIKNPTHQQKLYAVQNNGENLLYIKNPTKDIYIEAVKKTPKMIRFGNSNFLDYDLINNIIQQDPTLIRYVNKPTDEMWITALKHDGMLLAFCLIQKDEFCIEALKQNPKAVFFILSFTLNIKKFLEQQTPYAYIYYEPYLF
jgi:hypothetical protein